jgi:two-component system, NtrC family, sensor histidine kinase HydH
MTPTAALSQDTSQGVHSLRQPLFEFYDESRPADRTLTQGHQTLREEVVRLDDLNSTMHGMLDALEVGVVALDADGCVATMNRTAERMLGIDYETARGTRYHLLRTTFVKRPSVMRYIKSGAQPKPERRVLRHADCRETVVESSISLLTDDSGAVVGAINTLKDMTPFDEMERSLERNARMASIGRMASTLAHEIRNPLTAIAGFSELLASDMSEDDPRRRFAENIVSAVEALDQAVTSTLVFAKTPRLTLAHVDPIQVLADMVALVEQELQANGRSDFEILAENSGDTIGLAMVADVEQIKRALLNLMRNAIEMMPEGGRIILRLSNHDAGMLRFSIIDEGSGIPHEIRDSLFDPFETTKSEGTGLGLAVVRKIAEIHHGSVSVESDGSTGATFHLDLPLEQIGVVAHTCK